MSGRTPLATYNYGAHNGKLQSVIYANGTTLTYEYDDLERLKKVKNGNTVVEEYTYDLFGNVTKLTDGNWTQNYIYDDFNRVLETHSSGNGELRAQYGYDTKSRLSAALYEFTYNDLSAPLNLYEYEYGLNEAVSRVKHNSQSLLEYVFDSLGRRQSVLYPKLTEHRGRFSVSGRTPLATYNYGAHNGKLQSVTYANGTTLT